MGRGWESHVVEGKGEPGVSHLDHQKRHRAKVPGGQRFSSLPGASLLSSFHLEEKGLEAKHGGAGSEQDGETL